MSQDRPGHNRAARIARPLAPRAIVSDPVLIVYPNAIIVNLVVIFVSKEERTLRSLA